MLVTPLDHPLAAAPAPSFVDCLAHGHVGLGANSALALYLEDTVVMIAALIPWSIAGTVPLDSIGAPVICLLGGVYLYLVPLWQGVVHLRRVWYNKEKRRKGAKP